jgi:transcriptional regulator with XRE-family HTH domain
MNYNLIEIGKRIKDERRKLDPSDPRFKDAIIEIKRKKTFISQTDLMNILSENYGITRRTNRNIISALENGKPLGGELDLDTLMAMSDIFKCDIGYLLGEYSTRTREAADIQGLTGFSDLAAENLMVICGAPENGPLDRAYIENPHDDLRSGHIAQHSNFHFIELLLEHGGYNEELEKISVCAYDYKRYMDQDSIIPNYERDGIPLRDLAEMHEVRAREALSDLFSKIDWKILDWEE